MKENSIGDKITSAIIISILACLFTGGIATSMHWHVPIVCILTALIVCAIVFGKSSDSDD